MEIPFDLETGDELDADVIVIGAGAAGLAAARTLAASSLGANRHAVPNEPHTLHARAAIVTLPVGVLRHTGGDAVVFDPTLPPATREALDYIEMGPS